MYTMYTNYCDVFIYGSKLFTGTTPWREEVHQPNAVITSV